MAELYRPPSCSFHTTGEAVTAESSIPLFIDPPAISGHFTLYLEQGGPRSSNMNLSVQGCAFSLSDTVPLTVFNVAATGLVPLYVKAACGFFGSAPASGTMNLFLNRPTDAGFSLFLSGQGEPASGLVFLTTEGSAPVPSSLTLVFPDVVGANVSGVPQFVRGF